MPKTTKSGDARTDEIPSTLQRSDEKAQRTFAKAHDSAMDSYDDEQRANQVAWAAVKHTHEKVGDHWEEKTRGNGPSDPQAEGGRDTDRETKGGVDANATKEHLMDVAKRLDVHGRSTMSKDELVDAIQKANDRKTAEARKRS
jgi:cation transport regulator ChaB